MTEKPPTRPRWRLGGCLAYPLAFYGVARLAADIVAGLAYLFHGS